MRVVVTVTVTARGVDVCRGRSRIPRLQLSLANDIGEIARVTPALRGLDGVAPFDLDTLTDSVLHLEHSARLRGRGRAMRQRQYLLASGALDVIRAIVEHAGGSS